MVSAIKRILDIPELQRKILFTFLILLVCRLGGFIPVPGVNSEQALRVFKSATGGAQNLFQLVDIFSGGAFSQMNVVALSVVPYISASIIMQLVIALFPSVQREIRELGEAGRRKMNNWIRYLTLLFALVQSTVFARYALQLNSQFPGIIQPSILESQIFSVPWLFFLVMTVTMTSGTLILMWLGEQISERGIGNGISLIIAVGILSQMPSALGVIVQQLNLASPFSGQISLLTVGLLMGLFAAVVAGTILLIQGQRNIPVQYARRVVGNREMQGGGANYVPLKVNYAGVIPVIFASSLLMFPATIGQFFGPESFIGRMSLYLTPGSVLYLILYVLLIVFFTYFWTATQFRPDQIASEMKKNGAFIPGVRQGKPTQSYLEKTMGRITLIGALSLATIAVLPTIVGRVLGLPPIVSYFFGGTALLILVGVILDTLKQVESHLLMRRYEGFMRKNRGKRY